MVGRKEKFEKSIKYVELGNDGSIRKVLGVCKACELQHKADFVSAKKVVGNYKDYWNKDVFVELGIRRI